MKIILSTSEATPILENHFTEINGSSCQVSIENPPSRVLTIESATKAAAAVVSSLRIDPGNKIAAIKALRTWASNNKNEVFYGLAEAKNFVCGIWPD